MGARLEGQKLRCFLSAPNFVDTTALREILAHLEVEVSSIENLPPAGDLPTARLVDQIRNASFVLCVLPAERGGAALFELGVGIGLGKPVFLVVENKESLATGLLSLPLVISPPDASETLRFHLEAFIDNLKLPAKTSSSKVKIPRFYGGGPAIELTPMPARPASGFLAELRVAKAFQRIGGLVTLSPTFGSDAEADMVVWLPGATDIGAGGPVLVEVKPMAKERFPANGVRQLERLIRRSHLRAAILVTGTAEKGVAARVIDGAYLYALSAAELEKFSAAEDLMLELAKARNRQAHGASLS